MNIVNDSLSIVKNEIFHSRKSPKENAKEGKKPRKWDLGGGSSDLPFLDYTKDKDNKTEQESSFSTNTEVMN